MKQETFRKGFTGVVALGVAGVAVSYYGSLNRDLALKGKNEQSCEQLADVIRDMHPTPEQQGIFCQNELVRERLGRCLVFKGICTEPSNAKR